MSRAARSFTDPYSNVVALSGIDIREHFAALAGQQPLSPRLLPTLLHELVHHWCFDSPVGLALTLQSMLARRHAMQQQVFGEAIDSIELIDGFTRHHYLDGLLRTVSEGLALFAEHDLVFGDSSIISPPAALASVMVTERGDTGPQRLGITNALLSAVRVTRSHVRSKANLLVQALTSDDGAYLASYLSIKDLWLSGASKARKLQDTDLFVHLLRCYFFCDWELVAILLDPETSDVGTFEPLGRHIAKRISTFSSMSPDELVQLVDAFEDRGLRGIVDSFEHMTDRVQFRLNCHPTEIAGPQHELGKDRLKTLLDAVFAPDPSGGVELDAFLRMNATMLTFRSFITLAHGEFEARVAADGSRVVIFDRGVPFASLPSPGAEANWRGRAELELVWSTTLPLGMYAFLLMDGQMHVARLQGDAEVHESLRDSHGGRSFRLEYGQKTAQWLRDGVLGDESGAFLFDFAEKSIADFVEQLFCRPFRLPMSQEDGLLEALGGTTADVQRAALLSLCYPTSTPLSEAPWPEGVTATEYIERVSGVFAQHWPDFKPLEVIGDAVFSRI